MGEGKIKLTFMIGTLKVGGAERQMVELIKRLPRDRYEVRVCLLIGGGPLRKIVRDLGVEVHEVDFQAKYRKYNPICYTNFLHTLLKLRSYFRRTRPDIVDCRLYWAYIFGALGAKIAGVPCIVTGRRGLHTSREQSWKRWLCNFTNRFVTAVVPNSRGVREDMLQHEKISTEKIRVIYNGVEFIPPNPHVVAELKTAFHLTPDDVVAGCVANLHPYKGHKEIILAAVDLMKHYHNLKVMFVGAELEESAELHSLARRHKIEDRILFAGQRSEIPEFLALFDIFVLASYHEGFSNAILEAMRAGLPSVVTNVGGNPEQIEDGQTGFIVEPRNHTQLAEALERLITDPDLRHRMGGKATREAAKRFSMDALVHNFENLYEELFRTINNEGKKTAE